MFDLVYSNSCSFGAPGQRHKVYADHVSEKFRADLVNRGIPGCCNRRIIRSSLRDLSQMTPGKKILVLLGLTFVSRTELWQPGLPAQDNDGHFHSITVDFTKINWREKGLVDTIVKDIWKLARSEVKDYYKHWLSHLSMESEVTNLLTDIIMFTGWCRNSNIKYCIFANTDVLPDDSKVGYNSPFILSLRETVEADQNILDLWNFSFKKHALAHNLKPKDFDTFGESGHPGEEAHQLFANLLIDRINDSL